jgi:hypothetical protein
LSERTPMEISALLKAELSFLESLKNNIFYTLISLKDSNSEMVVSNAKYL